MKVRVLAALALLLWQPIGTIADAAEAGTARAAIPASATQPAPQRQDEFLPVEQLPADERLPAARLLVSAYAFVWLLLLGYLWSIRRRLMRIERELGEVARRTELGERRR